MTVVPCLGLSENLAVARITPLPASLEQVIAASCVSKSSGNVGWIQNTDNILYRFHCLEALLKNQLSL